MDSPKSITVRGVTFVVENHMKMHNISSFNNKSLKKLFMQPYFEDLLELSRIDALGSSGDPNRVGTYLFTDTRWTYVVTSDGEVSVGADHPLAP